MSAVLERPVLARGASLPLVLLPGLGAVLVWSSPWPAGIGVVVTLAGAALVTGATLAPLRHHLRRRRH